MLGPCGQVGCSKPNRAEEGVSITNGSRRDCASRAPEWSLGSVVTKPPLETLSVDMVVPIPLSPKPDETP